MSQPAPVRSSRGIALRHLLFALFASFALSNVLVPAFLGKSGLAAVSAIVAGGFLALLSLGERRRGRHELVTWRVLVICLAVACILLLLGGEGRVFFANEDWQIRDAVLADMAHHQWPFVYLTNGGEHALRAPLGMYLLPALLGGNSQIADDVALLACNALTLGILLAMASTLFETARAKRIALIVFIAFSGLDIVGTFLANAAGTASFDHLERWSPPLQYSSVITLIFWVPQHAIAGWFCALLYLLHRRGSLTLGGLAASVPLAAIWSPLAVIGAVPLVCWAGLSALRDRTWRWTDIAIGVAALALAVPALFYLAADAQQLPSGLRSVPLMTFVIFLLLEVAPFLWILYRLRISNRADVHTLAIVAVTLALIPLFHIGSGDDVVMRSSIAPIAVLIALVASALTSAARIRRSTAIGAAVLLSLGAVTGAAETARALRLRPAPPPRCSVPGAWYRQSGRITDVSTYLARTGAMPALLRPEAPASIDTHADPGRCWSRPWKMER